MAARCERLGPGCRDACVSLTPAARRPPGPMSATTPNHKPQLDGGVHLQSGARLHGANDPDFRTIVVLCDTHSDLRLPRAL